MARRAAHLGTGSGRYEHLGIEAGRQHLRGLDRLRRQHAVGDEEHVGVEAGALLAGPHLGDDPGEPYQLVAPRNCALAHHDVVELEVLLGRDRDPERQGRGVFGAQDPADGVRAVVGLVGHVGDGTSGV